MLCTCVFAAPEVSFPLTPNWCSGKMGKLQTDIDFKKRNPMKFTYQEALELGNALLDGAELSNKYQSEVNLTQTKSGRLVAIHGDRDCCTMYTVDPPVSEPDLPEVSIAS